MSNIRRLPSRSRTRKRNPAHRISGAVKANQAGRTQPQAGRKSGPRCSRKHKSEAQSEAKSRELLSGLFQTLSEEFPTMDEEAISEAVSGAYRYHLRNPSDFQSADGLPLEYYLLYLATRKLKSRLSLRKAA